MKFPASNHFGGKYTPTLDSHQDLSDGFATPMRGKSPPCREAASLFSSVSDRLSKNVGGGHRPPGLGASSRQVKDLPRIGVAEPFGLTVRVSGVVYGDPNRPRYSNEVINALTISAARKSPLNALSLLSQNWKPDSSGLRRR